MATYKVKKGDTLSGIAASQGVKLSDISGYRSGNPDLIYEGETLNIGVPETDTGSTTGVTQEDASGMSTKDLSIALATEYGETPEVDDGPSIETYRSDYDTYKGKREESFQKLQGLTTDTFNTEYESRELGKKKERIAKLDDDIASLRAARDADMNEVRKNPNLSAAQMTGDVKKQADFYNAQINNLITERNSISTEYNSALDEIDRIVENAVTDAQSEFAYYSGLFDEAGSNITSYEEALREALKDEQEQENFEDQLAQALTIAQMRESGGGSGGGNDDNWRLVYDDFGEPLYWFNSATKEIEYINSDNQNSGGGNTSFDDLEAELDGEEGGDGNFKWYNPLTWF
jgi:murein DD-endopeptidase MepM/ murein hydrolase activator NlpD